MKWKQNSEPRGACHDCACTLRGCQIWLAMDPSPTVPWTVSVCMVCHPGDSLIEKGLRVLLAWWKEDYRRVPGAMELEIHAALAELETAAGAGAL